MQLYHIHVPVCPVCGARIIVERQENQHCSGEWNEEREFQCGYQLVYSPNFSKVIVTHQCKNNPEYKAIVEKRAKAKEKLVKYINKLDTDKDYIKRILRDIEYT